ncbi:type VII secretion target [Actinoplanes sp. CA-252034]|uniref:type VII secretion target n=1 Tax=Actinoplanes sp. CA-252034 TaxID=3239906 RepID=UPI003D99B6A5
MADGFSADVEQIREHAAKIAAISDRFAAVTAASAAITRNDEAYGLLCGWMSGILQERHEAQKTIFSYVEENLRLAQEALIRTGQDYTAADTAAADRIRRAGTL